MRGGDAAALRTHSPLPSKKLAAITERDRLQPGRTERTLRLQASRTGYGSQQTSRRPCTSQFWAWALVALGLGVGSGVWVVYDPQWIHQAVATCLLVMLLFWATRARQAGSKHFDLTVVAVFLSIQAAALDLGPLNPLNIAIVIICALALLDRLRDPFAPWRPRGFGHLVIGFGG